MGEGPIDLVVAPGWLSNLDLLWVNPGWVRFITGLASFARVIRYDARGCGLSDPIDRAQPLESRADDLEVVVSSTVKDLVSGSGIAFADRGMHALKGIPDEWRLFAVSTQHAMLRFHRRAGARIWAVAGNAHRALAPRCLDSAANATCAAS